MTRTSTTTTTTAGNGTGPAARPRPRPAASPLRQALRLTRTEFTLFYRYRTAWLYLGICGMFPFVAMSMPADEVLPGVSADVHYLAGAMAGIGVIAGVGHCSNVFTARREAMVLKRFRVSGVPPAALFGSITACVTALALAVAVLFGAYLALVRDTLPADPVMVLAAVVLVTVVMSLFGLLFTLMARNAESAQMVSMAPMMAFLLAGGLLIPLDVLPERAHSLVQLLPVAPASLMAQAGYSGYDVFGGLAQAEPATALELWAAAGPSLLVMLGWTAALAYLLRYFRWDPRRP